MTETKLRKHPVIEIFGPTIQGEGALIGAPTHFIRFGGCDYRCIWCDSMFAVKPEEVRENSEKLDYEQILTRIISLEGNPAWITLSGGNPALHELGDLVIALQESGFKVAVETQGTVFKEWLAMCDLVTVSPKPPSSGNVTSIETIEKFLNGFRETQLYMPELVYKIVVFDMGDFAYLQEVAHHLPSSYSLYASTGTEYWEDTQEDLLARTASLAKLITDDPNLGRVRVLPQLHYLLYGNVRGV